MVFSLLLNFYYNLFYCIGNFELGNENIILRKVENLVVVIRFFK